MSQFSENTDSFLDKKYRQALLFDFYGELLKSNNRDIYEDYILNDLSLSEIANDRGISRQGIHDTIKRTNNRLEEYESKIHLLRKYSNIQNKVDEIQSIIKELKDNTELGSNDTTNTDTEHKLECNNELKHSNELDKKEVSFSQRLNNKLSQIEDILKDIINET